MTTTPLQQPDTHADRQPSSMVTASDVTKTYQAGNRSLEILHGVSLEVRTSEMCAVMGPSGSGKSTLLYCLAGLEQPSTGEVRLLGKPTHQLSRAASAKMRRAEVGFVFQSYNLVPSLTAFENVALPMRLRGERPDRSVIENALATVGLAAQSNARPAVMSGGEQQRVALARVLAQQPRVLFADEPTGALDTASGEVVLSELRQIAHQPGQSVLTVTHDPQVAARCDRVLFLRDGYLVRELAAPSAELVAETLTEITEVNSVVRS
ncbi:MAG: ABC transporter ATP-binding protein [Nocardioides sp.]|uniref:ABC transporter ATP-binding protein n=1 Tax=Nocardioides sp. TaxID=35761 RepID=UPI0039E26926